jgi:nucleoid-associated protein YgaU
LLCLALLCLAAPAHGQSLGDIARQERARKASQQQEQPNHVYDNDDLSRPQILAPQDKQRVEAPTLQVTAPAQPTPPAAPAPPAPAPAVAQTTTPAPASNVSYASYSPNTNSAPLGDIARYYRAQKAARQQQAPQTADQHPAPVTPQAAQTTDSAEATSDGNASSVSFLSPPPNLNSMPLGDIARYYRAQKAARQLQQSQSAEQHALPADSPMAYPTFTSPPAKPSPPPVAVTDRLPHVQSAPNATSREEDRAAGGGDARIRVQRGDTLWNLARKYLGHGRSWSLLAAANPQLPVPTRLRIGAWVRLPLPEGGPDSGPGERVRVQAGDSLWKLSQVHFGDGRAWGCIARANPELRNANLIFSGDILTIPGSCAAVGLRTHAPEVSAESLSNSALQLPTPVN